MITRRKKSKIKKANQALEKSSLTQQRYCNSQENKRSSGLGLGKRKFGHCVIAEDLSADVSSIDEIRHEWCRGNEVPCLGCICGQAHPSSSVAFWIQCDGRCNSWYHVAVHCVGFSEADARKIKFWSCLECSKVSLELSLFLDLPIGLLCNVLDFVAPPIDQAGFLCCKIASLCKTAHRTVHGEIWSTLWMSVFKKGYPFHRRTQLDPDMTYGKNKKLLQDYCLNKTRRRQSRVCAIAEVYRVHLLSCNRTDDAHMALHVAINSQRKPLTLKTLRAIFLEHGSVGGPPLRINRASHSGRSFLVECCAADYVDEGVILRCVRELIEKHGADPNVFTKDEKPYADRTPIYFAIARVMPTVVQYLVAAGACLSVKVSGRFRLVSELSKEFCGTYTPISFAKALKDRESKERLPPYYMKKLNTCIDILSRAGKDVRRI